MNATTNADLTNYDDSRPCFTITREGGEWLAVMDPIAAHHYGTPRVVGGYTTKRALLDSLKLLGIPLD